ncbi:mitogen-activated protein kinase kinase kinase NPK1 [Cynara cardunculus var. scolymus]|uniref:mitogen-activated protein kinase kinase kinase NPK1 n=1 Tax=Cynara cardunculus var. scolymus TaxID=59895 RepID=UPI000D62D953|nr:mitogen-activated protein kinase kinase kinase NPK1 [Cynara cardunculus var. scolymus]
MQDFIGSVRRSLVFKPSAGGGGNEDGVGGGSFGGFVEKIGSSIRKSKMGLFTKSSIQALPSPIDKSRAVGKKKKDEGGSQIRWRKGELIGCGAFGRVYMGMNLDSGELLAVKQVSVVVNTASKDKTQAHIRELEEEVKLLKNLSHPNIVRYLGTAREEESLNIFLEFVPGGSISSLLGKFGSFPESVLRMYTKQLLVGLEYLHKNGIMHRDIKGANILVDNKGRIKLADFGASKKVVELATMTGAKSMKGTPYWMAPEVILQTGHSFSADIWSVGCTVIEMATGKPPWSQQYQEVAALFHIGTTKAHPPIPDHLSAEAKDFLLKCLQKEPNLRPNASELLQHRFVTGEYEETHPVFRTSVMETPANKIPTSTKDPRNPVSPEMKTSRGMVDVHGMNSVRCSTIYPEKFSQGPMWGSNRYNDDMCQMDDDDLMASTSMKFDSTLPSLDVNKSFNPMIEPDDDWSCQFDGSPELSKNAANLRPDQFSETTAETHGALGNEDNGFTFPSGASGMEEEEELTETKIIAFLDEKALDLKKMQTPLYEEFYNSLNAAVCPVGSENKENLSNNLNLPPKSKSPNRLLRKRLSSAVNISYIGSAGNNSERVSHIGGVNDRNPQECRSPEHGQVKENIHDSQLEAISPSANFSDMQRRWKEELAEELERKRELMRQAGVVKTSSPKDRMISRQKERLRFAFPGN